MPTLSERVSDELLPYVSRPGQYIGREVNQLVTDRDWEQARIRVAVAFPDAYTVGMSHLGCHILYWLINHTEGCCAERVYCPWDDAESLMRSRHIDLFTWDTRQPVASADILAISLQYEMAYTSILQLLDLAGIPLRSADRDDSHPLVIAGGPQADNAEPMAPFVDLVVHGDGETSMAAILEACLEFKAGGMRRRDMIGAMARRFDWIYAPSLYDVRYHVDGTIQSMTPTDPDVPTAVVRCQTPDFELAACPIHPLVPFVEVAHDRMAIEIMRGCPQRCRFCHAGYTKRPLRFRSVDRILELAEEAYRSTGMDELGLLSLSTSDYPNLRELAERVNERFAPRHVNISMPSLRVDRMLHDIPSMVGGVRKSGLTIAVEAARENLRAAIRKRVTDGDLLDGVREAYKAGWRSVKLYFMCGFPGEQPEDIDGIVHLSREVSEARRAFAKGPAAVKVSVGWLVPKPHTPLQWAAQRDAAYFREARRCMSALVQRDGRRRSPIRIQTHSIERSILEGVFARGDRRLADAIEHAYRAGARFEGWDECFRPDIWARAFEATGVDPSWYAARERSFSEILPWSHLHTRSTPDSLWREYENVLVRIGAIGATSPGPSTSAPASGHPSDP